MDLSQLPERVRGIVEEYCRRKCGEAETLAYARGRADGRDDTLAIIRAIAPHTQLVAQPMIAATPVVVEKAVETPKEESHCQTVLESVKVPIPQELLSLPTPVVPETEDDVLGTAGFRDALDDLFGDDRWADLDRQELVRYVMLMVQEELADRGVDPTPVLALVRTLAQCGGGEYEATLLSLTDPVLLSWQAVPLRHPRGDFRFAAENLETGQKRYGEKALAHMRHANKDRHEFGEGEGQPYDLKGERTLAEHTEAFRKAKDSLTDLVKSLRAGESVRPGDLVDFQDRIGLLTGDDLKVLRRLLSDSLTSRVRAGKSKAERVDGIRAAFSRLSEAAAAITKAALAQAEGRGINVHTDPELLETLIEGEFPVEVPVPTQLSVAPNAPPKAEGKKAERPKAPPKADGYAADQPKPAPKPPEQAKPTAPPKAPAYSDYGVGGQKMAGVTPGRKTVGEVQQKSAEQEGPKSNAPAPKTGKPQDVPRPERTSASPMPRTPAGLAVPSEVAPKPNIRDGNEVVGKLHPAEQRVIDGEVTDFMTPEQQAAFQARLDEYQGLDAQRAYDEYDAANPLPVPDAAPPPVEGGSQVDPVFNDWHAFGDGPDGPGSGGRIVPGPFKPNIRATPQEALEFASQVPTDAGRRGMAKRVAMGLTGNGDPERRALFEKAWADAEAGRMDSPAVVELMQMSDDGRPETALAKQLTTAAFSPEDLGNAFSAWNETFGYDSGMNAMFGQFVPPAGAAEAQATESVRGLIDYFRQTGDRNVLPVLADAYEEAGVDARDLYVVRHRPDLIHKGMWAVTPPEVAPQPAPAPPVASPPVNLSAPTLKVWQPPARQPIRITSFLGR